VPKERTFDFSPLRVCSVCLLTDLPDPYDDEDEQESTKPKATGTNQWFCINENSNTKDDAYDDVPWGKIVLW